MGTRVANFKVLVAASNGYSPLPMETGGSGFTDPIALPSAAIMSPNDCNGENSYPGYENIGTANMTFNHTLCLAACNYGMHLPPPMPGSTGV